MKHKKDKYWSPDWVIEQIIPYIPKDVKTIWECAAGNRNVSKVLKRHGYKVLSSDITDENSIDFLEDDIENEYDMILTNPPFSLKSKFLERCYELDKPFLLLTPLTMMESKKRLKLYKQNGITIFYIPERVNFISSYEEDKDKVSKSPFFSQWVGLLPNHKSNTIVFL